MTRFLLIHCAVALLGAMEISSTPCRATLMLHCSLPIVPVNSVMVQTSAMRSSNISSPRASRRSPAHHQRLTSVIAAHKASLQCLGSSQRASAMMEAVAWTGSAYERSVRTYEVAPTPPT
ncbi:hypothetical protein C8Q76DRAFT_16892 [Earliella scabrosa]|nr:hypothetical protein C8Q76DRAFT_16892 [Earliella scabrosa]